MLQAACRTLWAMSLNKSNPHLESNKTDLRITWTWTDLRITFMQSSSVKDLSRHAKELHLPNPRDLMGFMLRRYAASSHMSDSFSPRNPSLQHFPLQARGSPDQQYSWPPCPSNLKLIDTCEAWSQHLHWHGNLIGLNSEVQESEIGYETKYHHS